MKGMLMSKDAEQKLKALEDTLFEHPQVGQPGSRGLSAGTLSVLENVGFGIVLQVLREVIKSEAVKARIRRVGIQVRDLLLIAYPLETTEGQ